MSDNVTFAPGFFQEEGPNTIGPMPIPFVMEDGSLQEIFCVPADYMQSTTLTEGGETIAVVAVATDALGIYAPAGPTQLRNMAAGLIAMADEIEAAAKARGNQS